MIKEISVWSLIEDHKFEKACERADELYRTTGYITELRNKVYALMHLKKFADAISLSEKIIEVQNGEAAADFAFLGIENWILGNFEKAVSAWQQAQNSVFKDAAGGIDTQVFLYFAGVKMKQDSLKSSAIKVIKKLLKTKQANNFPGPLGRFLIDEIKDNELLSSVDSTPIVKERELCQAYFVLALKRLEEGDAQGYYKKLRDCISYGTSSYLERMYYLAKAELEVQSQPFI